MHIKVLQNAANQFKHLKHECSIIGWPKNVNISIKLIFDIFYFRIRCINKYSKTIFHDVHEI